MRPSSKPLANCLLQDFPSIPPRGSFILTVHIAAVVLGGWLIFVAPNEWALIAAGWIVVHFILGSLSTTVYSHRLISHTAVKNVSIPVHLFFCFFGQVLSVQGSVRRWSANHVLHHGVDRHGKKELDPYSATWFPDTLRNFLWSHLLAHLFNHPESDAFLRSYNANVTRLLCCKISSTAC